MDGPDNDAEQLRKCRKACGFYQSKFSEVPALSSSDFLSGDYGNGVPSQAAAADDAGSIACRTVLVDVRTQPERAVSMIRDAISLEDFERMQPGSQNAQHPPARTDSMVVVTYCTIGYRSGLEARRLKDKYNLKGRIYSLDGIVAFTHALNDVRCVGSSQHSGTMDSHPQQEMHARFGGLVQPVASIQPAASGKPTNDVHVFAPQWSLAHSSFQATAYPTRQLVARFLQVAALVVGRTMEHLVHKLRSCLHRSPPRSHQD